MDPIDRSPPEAPRGATRVLAAVKLHVHSRSVNATAAIPASYEQRCQLVLRGAKAGLGPFVATRLMQVRNFALSGCALSEFVHTKAGTRLVLREIETQAGGGPL